MVQSKRAILIIVWLCFSGLWPSLGAEGLKKTKTSTLHVFKKAKYVVPHPDHQFLIHERLWKKHPSMAPVGDKFLEVEVHLLFEEDRLEIQDATTASLSRTIRYSTIDFAEYCRSRHNRPGQRVDVLLTLFLEKLGVAVLEKKHWLILHLQREGNPDLVPHSLEELAEQRSCAHFVVLLLDKNEARAVVQALEEEAGIKVLSVTRPLPWPWQWFWKGLQNWPPDWPTWQTYGQGTFNSPDQKRLAEKLDPERWRKGRSLDELDLTLERAYEQHLAQARKTVEETDDGSAYPSHLAEVSRQRVCLICLSGLALPSHSCNFDLRGLSENAALTKAGGGTR